MSKPKPKKANGPSQPRLVYQPQNPTQGHVRDVWPDRRFLILTGDQGTGKTTAALAEALAETLAWAAGGPRRFLWLARPMVSNDEDMGFLPGGVAEKLGPWFGAFRDCLGAVSDLHLDVLKDRTEFVSVGMLRGRTVSHGTLVVDEAQNCTAKQLRMLAGRVGRGGRVVLCGGLDQCDLRGGTGESPLLEYAERMAAVDGAEWVQFQKADQVRDPFVTAAMAALDAPAKSKRGRK